METLYLLPTTQSESCLLWVSAAPCVEWGWVRLMVFELSPQPPQSPRRWLRGETGWEEPLEPHPHSTKTPFFCSLTEHPFPAALVQPLEQPSLQGPPSRCSSLAPSPLPPSPWGHPWPSPHHHGHRASRSHILHLPARVTFGPWAALWSQLPLQRNKEKREERRDPAQLQVRVQQGDWGLQWTNRRAMDKETGGNVR